MTTLPPEAIAGLAAKLLEHIAADPKLSQLTGPDTVAVLRAAGGIVAAVIEAQMSVAMIQEALRPEGA